MDPTDYKEKEALDNKIEQMSSTTSADKKIDSISNKGKSIETGDVDIGSRGIMKNVECVGTAKNLVQDQCIDAVLSNRMESLKIDDNTKGRFENLTGVESNLSVEESNIDNSKKLDNVGTVSCTDKQFFKMETESSIDKMTVDAETKSTLSIGEIDFSLITQNLYDRDNTIYFQTHVGCELEEISNSPKKNLDVEIDQSNCSNLKSLDQKIRPTLEKSDSTEIEKVTNSSDKTEYMTIDQTISPVTQNASIIEHISNAPNKNESLAVNISKEEMMTDKVFYVHDRSESQLIDSTTSVNEEKVLINVKVSDISDESETQLVHSTTFDEENISKIDDASKISGSESHFDNLKSVSSDKKVLKTTSDIPEVYSTETKVDQEKSGFLNIDQLNILDKKDFHADSKIKENIKSSEASITDKTILKDLTKFSNIGDKGILNNDVIVSTVITNDNPSNEKLNTDNAEGTISTTTNDNMPKSLLDKTPINNWLKIDQQSNAPKIASPPDFVPEPNYQPPPTAVNEASNNNRVIENSQAPNLSLKPLPKKDECNDIYFEGTKKASNKQKHRSPKTQHEIPVLMSEVDDSEVSSSSQPPAPEIPKTAWSNTSSAKQLFPDVHSIVIDRNKEEDDLSQAVALSICTAQQENEWRKIRESSVNTPIQSTATDDDEWGKVRRNLPEDALLSGAECSAVQNSESGPVDTFGRLGGCTEKHMFMGKGARKKEQEYLKNISKNDPGAFQSQTTNITPAVESISKDSNTDKVKNKKVLDSTDKDKKEANKNRERPIHGRSDKDFDVSSTNKNEQKSETKNNIARGFCPIQTSNLAASTQNLPKTQENIQKSQNSSQTNTNANSDNNRHKFNNRSNRYGKNTDNMKKGQETSSNQNNSRSTENTNKNQNSAHQDNLNRNQNPRYLDNYNRHQNSRFPDNQNFNRNHNSRFPDNQNNSNRNQNSGHSDNFKNQNYSGRSDNFKNQNTGHSDHSKNQNTGHSDNFRNHNTGHTGHSDNFRNQNTGHSDHSKNQNTGHSDNFRNHNTGHSDNFRNQNTGHSNNFKNQNTGHSDNFRNQNTGHSDNFRNQNTGHSDHSKNQNSGHSENFKNQNTGHSDSLRNQNSSHSDNFRNQNTVHSDHSKIQNSGHFDHSRNQNTGHTDNSRNQNSSKYPDKSNKNQDNSSKNQTSTQSDNINRKPNYCQIESHPIQNLNVQSQDNNNKNQESSNKNQNPDRNKNTNPIKQDQAPKNQNNKNQKETCNKPSKFTSEYQDNSGKDQCRGTSNNTGSNQRKENLGHTTSQKVDFKNPKDMGANQSPRDAHQQKNLKESEEKKVKFSDTTKQTDNKEEQNVIPNNNLVKQNSFVMSSLPKEQNYNLSSSASSVDTGKELKNKDFKPVTSTANFGNDNVPPMTKLNVAMSFEGNEHLNRALGIDVRVPPVSTEFNQQSNKNTAPVQSTPVQPIIFHPQALNQNDSPSQSISCGNFSSPTGVININPSFESLGSNSCQDPDQYRLSKMYPQAANPITQAQLVEMELMVKMFKDSEAVATAKRYLAAAEANLLITQAKLKDVKSLLGDFQQQIIYPNPPNIGDDQTIQIQNNLPVDLPTKYSTLNYPALLPGIQRSIPPDAFGFQNIGTPQMSDFSNEPVNVNTITRSTGLFPTPVYPVVYTPNNPPLNSNSRPFIPQKESEKKGHFYKN